jgi:hypothetical protein
MEKSSSRPAWIKPEWIVFVAILLAGLAGALAILRWLAPQLFGMPMDLRLVQTSESRPAFYDGVFRSDDYRANAVLVNDPITVVRGRPGLREQAGLGPHDLLGFRNRAVPVVADVVVLGDSQTYGNNVQLEDNWPSRLRARLGPAIAGVYAMSSGGWGAVQYLEMATKVPAFKPQLVIVAFYTGNDALESFKVAHSVDRFSELRTNRELGPGDLPDVSFPSPTGEQWPVEFPDGSRSSNSSR